MKLIDLLEVTSDNARVKVFDTTYTKVALYDGRNSIDEIYNNYDVVEVWNSNNTLCICIDL